MDDAMKWKLIASQGGARKPFYQLSSRQQSKIKAEMRFLRMNVGHETKMNVSKGSDLREHAQFSDAPTTALPTQEQVDEVFSADEEFSHRCIDEDSDSDDIGSRGFVEQLEDKQTFRDKLAKCFAGQNITHVQGNSILKILRSHSCHSSLPKDMRTLLQTPRSQIATLAMDPGEYLHIGFEVGIIKRLSGLSDASIPPSLEIDVSTDGGTLDRSGSNQIWPIQFRIANIPNSRPEILGIFKGPRKPSCARKFFGPFIQETKQLMLNNGVEFRGKKIPFRFRCFIADAPARAFVLNHRGHMSANACSKCRVVGTYYRSRMVFLGSDHPLRSDEEYARHIDEDHHKEGDTPLSELGISVPSRVPFEYMHLGCLGAMKKILCALIEGNHSVLVKLSGRDIDLISRRLEALKEYCPREFARRPRTLRDYKQYKATELRQFLLYTGPIVLRGIMQPDAYLHFLLLNAIFRVLIAPLPSEDQLFFAETAMKKWVERCYTLYGPTFMSYNIHGLTHLVDDVRKLGPLDNFSAFPFENNMPYFRKFVRKPNLRLQQFVLRMAELPSEDSTSNSSESTGIQATDSHNAGPVPLNLQDSSQQFRKLKTDKFCLGLSVRDSCLILHDSSICILQNIILLDDSYYLIVKKFRNVDIFYDVGIPSTTVGVFECSSLSISDEAVRFLDVKGKCYRMPYSCNNNDYVADSSDDEADEFHGGQHYVVMAMIS